MRSVALPLPSSPHWAPTSTIAGIPAPSTRAPGKGCRDAPKAPRGYAPGPRTPHLIAGCRAPRARDRSAAAAGEGPAELEAGVDAVDRHELRDAPPHGAQADPEVARDGLVLEPE